MGEGKGAGEENAPASSEAELFTLLPGEVELHQGAGHSSRTDQVGDRDSIHDARCTGGHEEDETGKPSRGTRVRLGVRGWLLVEAMVQQKPRTLGEEDHSGPSRGVLGPEEAVRPESCPRRGEVAQGSCVSLSLCRRGGLRDEPWSLKF